MGGFLLLGQLGFIAGEKYRFGGVFLLALGILCHLLRVGPRGPAKVLALISLTNGRKAVASTDPWNQVGPAKANVNDLGGLVKLMVSGGKKCLMVIVEFGFSLFSPGLVKTVQVWAGPSSVALFIGSSCPPPC